MKPVRFACCQPGATVTSATPPTSDVELTVDQLAAQVGMTVRNVRAYASRGLLPPPRLVGRTGYYDQTHVARLTLVRQMLDEGYTLAAVERLLAQAPPEASPAELGLLRAMVSPWLPDEPEEVDTATLAARAGIDDDPSVIDQLVAIGVVERVGRGRVRVLNPALLAAGSHVVRLGIPVREVLAAQRKVARHAQQAARLYVDLIRDTVWREFVTAGMPDNDLANVQSVIEQLQPLAGQVLLATFRPAMAAAIEQAMGEELGVARSGGPARAAAEAATASAAG
jgi:DNA-binding transcriptional MerR regulator